MKVIRYTMLLLLLAATTGLYAQDSTVTKKKISYHFHIYAPPKPGKGYITTGGNGPLLSFADMKNNGEHVRNIPRFTMFFNVGKNYNYDFSNNFGIFSGLNIKNIGLISKPNDSVKLKQRVYTLGVPLGIKIGNLRDGFFFFAGGEYDLAFNYKEKYFLDGDKKSKFNEWFSDRTDLLMPSVFAGVRFQPGFGVKVQYYLNDFFNKDYSETVNGVKQQPYKDIKAQMLFVTLSYNFTGFKCDPGSKHYHKSNKERKGTKVIIEKRTEVVDK
ncbi:outer membrane beta-barrel protein [Chitinophaga sp. SYP-B3965]|uniref:outer membrane beta-barrel protein n=1 Tax=Chitinophaga sp. SYP-B3965 TaxID=2663120 RepID=UPI00129973B3|nr:outer membrane beta-barrel protein [Chitinophaga sp. SYP-B3965]MRG47702.1 outer membrane beta-barrel protein [Chitinophaga sp. SYP-B3965]